MGAILLLAEIGCQLWNWRNVVLSGADELPDWVAHLLMGEWHLLVAGFIRGPEPYQQTQWSAQPLLKALRPNHISGSVLDSVLSLSRTVYWKDKKMKYKKQLSDKQLDEVKHILIIAVLRFVCFFKQRKNDMFCFKLQNPTPLKTCLVRMHCAIPSQSSLK